VIRGLYTATTGMISEAIRTDVISNNVANVNTTGYKKDEAINSDFASVLLKRINDGEVQEVGKLGRGTVVAEVVVSQSQGAVRKTDNDFDLAIDGKGFFVVDTPQGERYTRNGSFLRSANGELVTSDGYKVMGTAGVITVDENAKFTVSPTGEIIVDDVPTDNLRLVDFAENVKLEKEGSTLFKAPNGATPTDSTATIVQGSIEMSNVNVVGEMVKLITAYRAYETNAKAVQSHDAMLDKAVNEVGKV
jgi:flagellar basal-body rod protein FlgF